MRPRMFTLALALALAGACRSGNKAPDCKAVGAAYAALQTREIEKPYAAATSPGDASASPDQKAQALSVIPLVKEAMVKECVEKKWNGETRRCIALATTLDDLERCRTRPEADQAGESPEKPPATSPETGKPDSPAR